jgi:hypothetical protein
MTPPCRLGAPCLCRSRSTRRACFGRLSSARQSCLSLVSALATCKRQRHTAPLAVAHSLLLNIIRSPPTHHCIAALATGDGSHNSAVCNSSMPTVVHPIIHPKTPSLTRPSHTCCPTPAARTGDTRDVISKGWRFRFESQDCSHTGHSPADCVGILCGRTYRTVSGAPLAPTVGWGICTTRIHMLRQAHGITPCSFRVQCIGYYCVSPCPTFLWCTLTSFRTSAKMGN